jgi:FkbM family methyltransferase
MSAGTTLDAIAAARARLDPQIAAVYARLRQGSLQAGDIVEEDQVGFATPARWITDVIAKRSVYEEDARIIGRFRGDVGAILDIGAHWGYLAASFRHAGADGPILSFEPMRAHHACLSAMRNADRLFDFAPTGLSDKPRRITLLGPVVNGHPILGLNSVDGTIFNDHHRAHLLSLVGTEIRLASDYHFQLMRSTIDAKPLDEVLRPRLFRPSPFRVDVSRIAVIKIDVEGHEPEVLAGAEATIGRHRPFVMIESGNRNRAVKAFFAARGYAYAERAGDRLVPMTGESTMPNGFWYDPARLSDYRDLGLF